MEWWAPLQDLLALLWECSAPILEWSPPLQNLPEPLLACSASLQECSTSLLKCSVLPQECSALPLECSALLPECSAPLPSVSTTVDDQVLDDEGAGEASRFPHARTALVPSRLLVEHDITRDKHLVSAWVVEPVCLGTLRIAQEDHGCAPVL